MYIFLSIVYYNIIYLIIIYILFFLVLKFSAGTTFREALAKTQSTNNNRSYL